MQRTKSNKIQLGATLSPLKDADAVPSVDNEGNLESLYSKVDKIGKFWKVGKADDNLARYIPNLTKVSRQNQISGTHPRKAFASQTYSDKKNLEFVIELVANTYSNYSTMCLVLLLQFTKKDKTTQMDADLMVVNNSFGHWIKDIDIKRHPDDTRILPTNSSVDVYQYLAEQLKYLPETSLYTVAKTFLYSRKPVYLEGGQVRRDLTNATAGKQTDLNLTDCRF